MNTNKDLRELYKNKPFQALFYDETLILADGNGARAGQSGDTPRPDSWQQKLVLLLPAEPDGAALTLLEKILGACGLTLAQVFVHYGTLPMAAVQSFTGARLLLSFGALDGLTPDHQLHKSGVNFIATYALDRLETDASAKKMLWKSLKDALRV